jgi:polysaccharide biosynthesis/export protein
MALKVDRKPALRLAIVPRILLLSHPHRKKLAPANVVVPAGLALLLSVLGGCADKAGGPIPYHVALSAPDQPKLVALESSYRIAPLDTVTVKVFKMPDLSGDYEVDLTGSISMPLVGSVSAAELTTTELDQKLTQVYGAKYLQNPDISVGVKASTRRSVTVDGAVKSTGSFPVSGPLSLMQAVALAGGTSEDANPRRVAIFRTIEGKRQAAAFDLASIRRGQAEDPPIYAGDIIVVDGSSVKALQKKILTNLPFLSIFRPF